LILENGDRKYFGSVQELKQRFADQTGGQTLEDIFFSAVSSVE
jgi:hypothetical protein